MRSLATATYNERLFDGGGVRSLLHASRFRWFATSLKRLGVEPESVCELGCYDGKLIDYLPRTPRRYVGFDANWEDGLSLAATRWRNRPEYVFHLCRGPQEMTLGPAEMFDVTIVMETLEHVSPEMAAAYLERLARHTTKYLFVTVPNETGPVFLIKWMVKRLWSHDTDNYSLAEVCHATLGRMSKVARHEHKGFDYREMVRTVSRYFDIVEVSGIPTGRLPGWLNFGIGIVGRPR